MGVEKKFMLCPLTSFPGDATDNIFGFEIPMKKSLDVVTFS